MGLSAKVGDILKPTVVGTVSETVGFETKTLILCPTRQTAVGRQNPASGTGAAASCFGAAVSTTDEGGMSLVYAEGETGGTTRRGAKIDRILSIVRRNTNSAGEEGNISAIDATSFTLDLTAVQIAQAWIMPYLALGGSDITNASVISFVTPLGTPPFNSSVTGAGFAPDLVILFANGITNAAGGYGSGGAVLMGAFNSTHQWAGMMGYGAQGNPTDTGRVFRSDRCYVANDLGSTNLRASFVSMDADGFTLNWDAVAGAEQQLIQALCLKGTFQHKIGVFNKATATPTGQNTIDLGFAGKAVFLASAQQVTGTTVQPHNRGGFGFYDGTNERSQCWLEQDNVSPSNGDAFLSRTKAFTIVDNDTPTVDAECDASFSGNNLVLDWTTNHATATEIGYVAFGEAAAGGGGETSVVLIQDGF